MTGKASSNQSIKLPEKRSASIRQINKKNMIDISQIDSLIALIFQIKTKVSIPIEMIFHITKQSFKTG